MAKMSHSQVCVPTGISAVQLMSCSGMCHVLMQTTRMRDYPSMGAEGTLWAAAC